MFGSIIDFFPTVLLRKRHKKIDLFCSSQCLTQREQQKKNQDKQIRHSVPKKRHAKPGVVLNSFGGGGKKNPVNRSHTRSLFHWAAARTARPSTARGATAAAAATTARRELEKKGDVDWFS